MKYDMYLRVLDQLIAEAPARFTRYQPDPSNPEKLLQARSRANLHLYLKVSFGLLDFESREHFVTDGSYDGGIDAYFLDRDGKALYLIQSKFRTTEENHENKKIGLDELLAMEVDRVLSGEKQDEYGNAYNGKILQLQRELSETSDLARYSYRVVILANCPNVSQANLRKLTDGHAAEVFNFERIYDELVFPVICGTYFTASEITIPIDLSNKNAGSKISYTVSTKISECEITALFVPTIELAKLMDKYKNSILKYNPRSYLDLAGQKVNQAIRDTLVDSEFNEFALYNNGITMLSDETFINEKVGQKNRAQLIVKNPQIINGGQTTYTLSRVYNENKRNNPEGIFKDKEVLVKIITLLDDSSDSDKMQLIDEISNATNQQTPVINADRFANESFHKRIQKVVFDRFGLLYERKRGEFSEGLHFGYISPAQIIERNQFFRIYYASNGHINFGSKKRLFQKNSFPHFSLEDGESLSNFVFAFHAFREIVRGQDPHKKYEKDLYAKLYVYSKLFGHGDCDMSADQVVRNVASLETIWRDFVRYIEKTTDYAKVPYVERATGDVKKRFSEIRFYRSAKMEKEVLKYFQSHAQKLAALAAGAIGSASIGE